MVSGKGVLKVSIFTFHLRFRTLPSPSRSSITLRRGSGGVPRSPPSSVSSLPEDGSSSLSGLWSRRWVYSNMANGSVT
jgi:hypothetical protein